MTTNTHHVIANPTNGGHWFNTGRVDFSGTLADCEAHLSVWSVADEEARANGYDAASCDARFIVTEAELSLEAA